MDIKIKPVKVTQKLMEHLEKIGVISCISPGKGRIQVQQGESKFKYIYSTKEEFGPHKLIAVTINSTMPSNFLYHSEAEDFLLIDSEENEKLIITMSLCVYSILENKIKNNTLNSEDFISIIMEPNNPYTSFFTMNKYYAHVETVLVESENPPSFYVTEPRDIDENLIDLKNYKLIIES